MVRRQKGLPRSRASFQRPLYSKGQGSNVDRRIRQIEDEGRKAFMLGEGFAI